MLTILAPALRIHPAAHSGLAVTRPAFLDEAAALTELLREYSPWELETLLRTNPELAMRAHIAYADFAPDKPGTPALLSYSGLAFHHLRADTFSDEDLAFAQDHVRVLSALYGVLRPLDGVLPYRLDFVSLFRPRGQTLYKHWGERIEGELTRSDKLLVDLCSSEYSKAFRPHLDSKITCITCHFRTIVRGKAKILSTHAKMARGAMTRFLIQNRIDSPEPLRAFAYEGFSFVPSQSTETDYVYIKQ